MPEKTLAISVGYTHLILHWAVLKVDKLSCFPSVTKCCYQQMEAVFLSKMEHKNKICMERSDMERSEAFNPGGGRPKQVH